MRVDGRVAREKRPNMPPKKKRKTWRCSLCGEEKDYEGFSGSQLVQGVKERKCKDCASKTREALGGKETKGRLPRKAVGAVVTTGFPSPVVPRAPLQPLQPAAANVALGSQGGRSVKFSSDEGADSEDSERGASDSPRVGSEGGLDSSIESVVTSTLQRRGASDAADLNATHAISFLVQRWGPHGPTNEWEGAVLVAVPRMIGIERTFFTFPAELPDGGIDVGRTPRKNLLRAAGEGNCSKFHFKTDAEGGGPIIDTRSKRGGGQPWVWTDLDGLKCLLRDNKFTGPKGLHVKGLFGDEYLHRFRYILESLSNVAAAANSYEVWCQMYGGAVTSQTAPEGEIEHLGGGSLAQSAAGGADGPEAGDAVPGSAEAAQSTAVAGKRRTSIVQHAKFLTGQLGELAYLLQTMCTVLTFGKRCIAKQLEDEHKNRQEDKSNTFCQ